MLGPEREALTILRENGTDAPDWGTFQKRKRENKGQTKEGKKVNIIGRKGWWGGKSRKTKQGQKCSGGKASKQKRKTVGGNFRRIEEGGRPC